AGLDPRHRPDRGLAPPGDDPLPPWACSPVGRPPPSPRAPRHPLARRARRHARGAGPRLRHAAGGPDAPGPRRRDVRPRLARPVLAWQPLHRQGLRRTRAERGRRVKSIVLLVTGRVEERALARSLARVFPDADIVTQPRIDGFTSSRLPPV